MKVTLSKVIALFCSISLVMAMGAGAVAEEKPVVQQAFVDLLLPIYSVPDTEYRVTDGNGQDRSDVFLLETKHLYQKGDWQSIYEIVFQENWQIRVTQARVQLYSGDIAKSEKAYVKRNIKPDRPIPDVDTSQYYVEAVISGTIYYDPNTAVVSHASAAIADSVRILPDIYSDPIVTNLRPHSSFAKYSGTFGCTMGATVYFYGVGRVPMIDAITESRVIDLSIQIRP